ncbi:MAG: efflux RND transporter permease subunit [Planctomycetota bacterium]
MSALAAFGVRKPTVANLVMYAILAAGILFGLGLRREFFPEVRPTVVNVTAPYPGAAPDEVEESLATKIEDRVADLDDVKEVNTVVSEGLASISIEFEEGVDITESLFEVKREMDALQDLPDESDRITVDTFEANLPVIVLSLAGDEDERSMKEAIRAIREDLRSLPGMGDVAISGVRTDELRVEVDPNALLQHGLSIPLISDKIRQEMVELPGGSVRTPTLNSAVRTLGAEERAEAVREIIVKASPGGQVLRVRDIADVRETFEDVDTRERINGKPAVSLTVYKKGDQDAVAMSEMVKAYVAGRNRASIEPTLMERVLALVRKPDDTSPVSPRLEAYELGLSRPSDLSGELVLSTDLARFIVGRLDLLSRNAGMGLVLVLVTLVLLLNLRVAFWVALGLLIAIVGTLAVMRLTGITLNLLTMFGLIIVIGLLVDDAIVVAENISRRHEEGESASESAIEGTRQVNWPVVSTVLTTIAAFMPLGLLNGQIGDLLGVLPLVVMCALAVSLVECLFILPAHMAHSLKAMDARASRPPGWGSRLGARMERGRKWLFEDTIIPAYDRSLRWALGHRYLTLSIAISLVIASAGMVAGGRVPFLFIDSSDAETVNAELRMPIGTPASETDAIIRQIEAASQAQPEVSSVFSGVGSISSLEGGSTTASSHIGQVILELVPVEERDRSSEEVIFSIREALGELPGVKSLAFAEIGGGPEGPAVSLGIVGESTERLAAAADLLKHELNTFDGVFNVTDDFESGRREVRFRLKPGADELGFTTENIARQVRGAVFGLEAHTFAGDREDIDVRVTYPESWRRSVAAIEGMHVFTPSGQPVPLGEVVFVEEADGYATIRRLDRERIITVSAEVDPAVNNPEDVANSLGPAIERVMRENPGVRIVSRGRQKDMAESFESLPLGMATAIGLIYVILAWLFASYTQPLAVLSAVPFATIGMIWGHYLLGFDMTFLSLIGFIALTGVVVNDSLILMEFYNERRREGDAVYDALVIAGRARVRAILLTTITTVFGLLPLMLEQSFQARFLIPMAITISCGLLSATLIILIVLPCILMIFEDARRAVRWVVSGSS